jgi:hypothetical protein
VEKRICHYLIVAVAAAVTTAGCHNTGSRHEGSRPLGAAAASYRYYRGTVDNHEVVLQLVNYPDGFEGIFTADSLGQPLAVAGHGTGKDSLTLVVYDHYDALDTLRGSFPQPGVFQGTRTDTAGTSVPFTLQEIYAPGTIHWNVYTLTDSLAFDTTQNAPMARFRAVVLWPAKKDLSGGGYSVLTDSISTRLFGRDSAAASALALLRGLRDSFFAGYHALSAKFEGKDPGGVRATFNWECDYDMKVLWNADSTVSVSATSYQYTGGAHGLSNNTVLAFDLKHARTHGLGDLFQPGYEAPLQQVLEKHLRVQYDLGSSAPLNGRTGMLFNPHLALTSNFYVTGKGIGFVYNPYEVAPYSYGVIELFVPFSELRNLRTPSR